jgi:hypothetical protein
MTHDELEEEGVFDQWIWEKRSCETRVSPLLTISFLFSLAPI